MATIQAGQVFVPAVGKCYEVHFGRVSIGGKTGFCHAHIRATGALVTQWDDLDTGKPLDPRIGAYAVLGYKEIPSP